MKKLNSESQKEAAVEKLGKQVKNGRFVVIKMSSVLVMLFVLFGFGSVAWFTLSRPPQTAEALLKAGNTMFELAADNDETSFDPYLEAASANVSENLTTSVVDTIKWFMSDDTVTEENTGLHPGSHGTLSFRLYPKSEEDLSIQFSILTTVYQYVRDGEGNILKDAQGVDRIVKIDPMENPTPVNYIRGHILFFEDFDDGTGYYSKRIDNYFVYDTTDHTAEAAVDSGGKLYYPVTIYWIWPNTFGQMVLDNGDTDLRDAAMFDTTQGTYTPVDSISLITPRNELIEYITSDSGAYFFDHLNSGGSTLATMMSSAESIKSNIIPLSNGYNNADQVIGENVDLLLCELLAVINT